MNRTKIIATLGPASSSEEGIRSLIEAGVSCFRLNFSHGSHEVHDQTISRVRAIAGEMGRPVTVIQDLQGPKIRIGTLREDPVTLTKGETVCLVTDGSDCAGQGDLPVDHPILREELKPGMRVLLDDGLITLTVTEIVLKGVACSVVDGGTVHSRKGVNLPDTDLSLPSLTEKDLADLTFGLDRGVDWVSLSFVRRPEDLDDLRKAMEAHGTARPVIAKIEKPQALENLEGILDSADGIMVARGDLGVEMSPEKVPLAQKTIIESCNRRGIPVITATQMLESMIREPVPTRAEASDVANAIMDGTDAVMLSGETAVGRYPVRSVEMMASIATEVEAHITFRNYPTTAASSTHALSEAVTVIEEVVEPMAIVVLTASGLSSRLVSAERPRSPILALTHSPTVLHAINLFWGVTPVLLSNPISSLEELSSVAQEIAGRRLNTVTGDTLIILGGLPPGIPGGTNVIKIHTIT